MSPKESQPHRAPNNFSKMEKHNTHKELPQNDYMKIGNFKITRLISHLNSRGCSPWPICVCFRPFIISSVISSVFLHFPSSLHLCLQLPLQMFQASSSSPPLEDHFKGQQAAGVILLFDHIKVNLEDDIVFRKPRREK